MRFWLIALVFLCGWAAAPVGMGPGPAVGIVTKLPVPRFVSLRTDRVNVRAGPGFQYPVTWVYQRDGLPVEVIGEFDVWRQILAPDGGTGWVHMATIRARRTFIVTAPQADLRANPQPDAGIVAYLNNGVTGLLLSCTADDWCQVDAGHVRGYLRRADFWGTFSGEAFK